MASANKKDIMSRYFFIVLLMTLVGIAIIVKAAIIMFAERSYWNEVADRFVKENVSMPSIRGNILSSDGKLMASSLPEYRIYLDFKAGGEKKDTMLVNHIDEIAEGLHKIFPDWSANRFRQHLLNGRKQGSRYYQIYPKRISYIQLKRAKELPVFKMGRNASGFFEVEYNQRKKPFGSLAARTLGDMYADTALGAKNGLELSFDSILKGRNGITHRQKVMNKWLSIVDVPPVDGADIVSTIDVDMQDIAEKALTDEMREINANVGVVVLMEVATGEVKAIVNLTKGSDGGYYEMKNNAISDMLEPGSTFKTASIMVALEDGYIDPHTMVDTGNGVKMMHGSAMKDHNWHRGGYGEIDVTRILEVSSNVGVSSIIDKYYKDDPGKFVDGLKRMSINEPLHLQILGEGKPNIKGPKERYFAKTTLPWMSIGYETQIPPINILTFYNAIANNGTMIRPKFVREIVKDGNVIKSFPTEVINPKICSDKTLGEIREILTKVVSQGLAKPAGSKQFSVAGKTGTAQISQGAAGYHSNRRYLVSFCGFFPADAPKYSMIVSIQKPGLPASGGTMAGSVFGKIAERVYAKDLHHDLHHAIDSTTNVIPNVKSGQLGETYYVLNQLDIPMKGTSIARANEEKWGHTESDSTSVSFSVMEDKENIMPNVVGMGAKDAVYLLEKSGLNVRLTGLGRVRRQNIPAGHSYSKGQTVSLTLN